MARPARSPLGAPPAPSASRASPRAPLRTDAHDRAIALALAHLAARDRAPTPVQSAVFPALASRQHLLVVAPTGTGKTAAVMLPLLATMALSPRSDPGVRALYVVPVRALARSARDAVAELCAVAPGLRVGARTGDTPARERSKLLRSPPAVLVTTPESLAVMLATDARETLRRVDDVVLDEVHLLAEGKRGALLSTTLALLDALREPDRPRARRLAMSATAGDAPRLAAWVDRDARALTAGGGVAPSLSLSPPPMDEAFPSGSWAMRRALPMVARCVAEAGSSTLVFVSARSRAEQWAMALRDVLPERLGVACYHGSLSAEAREEVGVGLRDGSLRAVVATSGLEVGVDLQRVGEVVVLGAPPTASRLLQAAGRADHRPGESPRARLVPTSGLDLVRCAAVLREARASVTEPVELREGDLDVAIQAALARCAAGPCTRDEIAAALRASWSLRDLDERDLDEVLRFVTTGGAALAAYPEMARVVTDGERYALSGKRSLIRYLQSVGAIVGDVSVEVRHGQRPVGQIEGRFAAALEVGDRFVLSGRVWRVTSRAPDAVMVRPDAADRRAFPAWFGARAAQSAVVAASVERAWGELDVLVERGGDAAEVAALLDVDEGNARAVLAMVEAQRRVSAVPAPGRFVVERVADGAVTHLVAHTFAGAMANEVIARAVATRLRDETGAGAQVACLDESLCVTTEAPRRGLSEPRLRELFSPDGLREAMRETLTEGVLAGAFFREVARVSQLWRPEARRGAVTPGLLHDVLRKHDPGHVLLRAMEHTAWTTLDGPRAEDALARRARQRWVVTSPRAVPPLSIPVVAWIERDRVAPDDPERALADAARALYERTLRLASREP